jgi:hypothetical protein
VIALMALLAAVQAPAPAIPQQAPIVVSRQKLNSWKGSARFASGRYQCTTTHSSGDQAIDRLACDSMTGCMRQMQSTVDALLSGHPPRKERERILAGVNAQLRQCVQVANEEGLRQLDAQAASRQ